MALHHHLRRRARGLVALLLGSLLLTGCEFDIYELPLPGGTDTGEQPIQVTAHFRDVLDLVPMSDVKVNEVSVGRVTDIALEGYTAMVTLELRKDVDLPDNTVATIRQTSLLGEKFVSLAPPADGARGDLEDDDEITLDRTGRNPEVEEVFGALSLVLNGGGLAQLKTITTELNKALEGNEGAARSSLRQIEQLMGTLDENKGDIIRAIEALDRLAVTVNGQMKTIDRALAELPGALRSIDSQRGDLVRMLRALNRLSNVGVRVIDASKESMISTLELLEPTLSQLANSGDDLVNSLNAFYSYPFIDEAVGRDPQVARNLHMGDYVNLSVRLDLDLTGLDQVQEIACTTLEELPAGTPLEELGAHNLCNDAIETINACLQDMQDGEINSQACLQLPEHLLDTILDQVSGVCTALPQLSGVLGQLPVCGQNGGGGGEGVDDLIDDLPIIGGGGGGDVLGPITGGDGPIGGATDGLGGLAGGLGRAPAGWEQPEAYTVGQLRQAFDPALVDLMMPGMVTTR